MKNKIICLSLLLLFPCFVTTGWRQKPFFVVWNVGQGQWISFRQKFYCLHVDAGGEVRPPLKLVQRLCSKKKNFIYFTHFDWDHISFAKKLLRMDPQACVLHEIPHKSLSPIKNKSLSRIQSCKDDSVPQMPLQIYKPPVGKDPNSNSHVIVFAEKILVSGDSPIEMEKIWSKNLNLKKVEYVVGGHHGSYTSTSKTLLNRLPKIKLFIFSARKGRYGHPHAKTIQKLDLYNIPHIQTEAWGHIFIPL